MASATFRIITSNGGRLGRGKIALLEAIERTGSISGAARAVGMSYKRAWDLVDDAGRMFGAPLVCGKTGGRGGGGAALTERGRQVVACYRLFEAQALLAGRDALDALERYADSPDGAGQAADSRAGHAADIAAADRAISPPLPGRDDET